MNKKVIVLLVFAVALCQCKKKKEDVAPAPITQSPKNTPVDTYVTSLSDPLTPEKAEPKELQAGDFAKDGDYICRTSTYSAGYEFDESICLDPSTDVIYPGALIDGNSITTGEYQPINLKRGPATLSTSLITKDQGSSIVVPEVTLSSVRSAVSVLLNKDLAQAAPAQLTFQMIEVFSENQLLASVAAGVTSSKIDIKGKFDFSSSSKTSKILIKFVQQYYSIDVNAPIKPSEFVSNENDMDAVRAQIKDAAPCYVSSVKYGRMAFFYIESSESSKILKAALEATFNGGAVSANLEASIEKSQVVTNSKISGTIIGGSGADAGKAISGKAQMLEYITNGGNYSKDSPGAPIAYKLSLLSNNKMFRMVKATKYVIRECLKTTRGITITKMKSWDLDGQIFGTIIVALKYDGEVGEVTRTLFSKGRDQAINMGQNAESEPIVEAMNFDIDLAKLDKAYIEIRTNLKERDDKAVCDTDDLSRGQSKDADDDMFQVSGSFHVSDFKNRSGLELQAVTNLLYLSRISVQSDNEVYKEDNKNDRRYCRIGSYANPQIDVFFKYNQ